jgi:hypothetical protein
MDSFDMMQNKEFSKRGLKAAFAKIKNDKGKINVFSDLLNQE